MLVPSCISCVTPSQFLHFSVLWFSHLCCGDDNNSTYLQVDASTWGGACAWKVLSMYQLANIVNIRPCCLGWSHWIWFSFRFFFFFPSATNSWVDSGFHSLFFLGGNAKSGLIPSPLLPGLLDHFRQTLAAVMWPLHALLKDRTHVCVPLAGTHSD